MPFIIIGIVLAAAGVGAWAVLRPHEDTSAPSLAGEKNSYPGSQNTVWPDAVSPDSEATAPELPERVGNEPVDRWPGAPEVDPGAIARRVTTPAYLDGADALYDPLLDVSSIPVGGNRPSLEELWDGGDIQEMRDLSQAPLADGLLLTELK